MAAKAREFVISTERDPRNVIDVPADREEWPVDHPVDSPEWRWYAIWVENAFSNGRLAHGEKLPPSQGGEYRSDECVNFLTYREWLLQNAPTAKFVVLAPNTGSYQWIKIVFADHVEATAHMLQWEGSGPVTH